MKTRRANSRRGSVGLALVIVLVILQLLLVGVIASGARDQDLAVNRLDTFRSAYAAEAGENMALREIMNNADEDGDGGVGTISDDGNAANDPALGTARFSVSKSTAGAQSTFTSRGRSASTRRQASAVTQGASGGNSMAAFSRSASNQPRSSLWTGASWSASAALPSVGGEANFVVLRACPARSEVMCVTQDSFNDVNVVLYNGSSWGTVTEVCTDTGETLNRPFDAAYESSSGDGLVVYWKNASTLFGYRTWNGTTLSGESTLSLAGATDCNYMALYSRPGSDTIILLAQNTSSGTQRLSANVWGGGSWGGWTHLDTNIESNATECFSLAFETLSTHALAVYFESGDMVPRYRTWNGISWSGQASMPTIGGVGLWVRLVPDPTSDKILFAALDTGFDINVNAWSGSSWGTDLELDKKAGSSDRRVMDLAFENGTSHALIVYSENAKKQPRYRTWTGSWSAEAYGPNVGKETDVVNVVTGTATGEVLIGLGDQLGRLHLLSWDGSSMSGDTLIEPNLGGPGATDAFMLCGAGGGRPKLLSWTEEQPN